MVDSTRHPDTGDFRHDPVLVAEVVEVLAAVPDGPYLDGTLGGAGHAVALLEAHPGLRLVGIDRDPAALEAASRRLEPFADRVEIHRARFDELDDVLGPDRTLSGFLLDLGVSSPQLDRPERGFSYREDGPLDMRMDPDGPTTAADLVNDLPRAELARLLKQLGDERFADRIATAVVAARPIRGTVELAEIVVGAIPAAARRTGGHPAKRSFQALRIAVNAELDVLEPTLEAALERLVPGGRGVVLTYHSGEDRIVKDVFRRHSTSDVPVGLPVDVTPDFATLRPLARRASDAEQERNPRARSARLRAIERVAA